MSLHTGVSLLRYLQLQEPNAQQVLTFYRFFSPPHCLSCSYEASIVSKGKLVCQ